MSTTNEERRKTAIHEAGHAVAHSRLNIEQMYATIEPWNGTLGRVMGAVDSWDKDEAEAQVIAYCSGRAACIAALYADDHANEGCNDDFEKAQGLIDFWGLGNLSEWQSKAVELMQSPENIRAVDLIGKQLMQHDTVYNDCIDVLIEVADGVSTEVEFEEYVRVRALHKLP